jgi:hypothetical protein
MKLQSNAQPVEVIGAVSGKTAFTVKPTAKAFAVLSSKLYKNKIAAIVREISCNAYDAHIAAGTPNLPFEVHLPTILEPWFSVRDFGPGLSHQQTTTIFTTFFESTKEDSNDYIGALGLGSKSPFSYVDSFAVYSHHNGVRRSYECYLEHGIPQLSVKAETPTNGESGIEVSLAVQPEDFYLFQQEAASIYRWFRVRPVIFGQTIDIQDWIEPEGCGWSRQPRCPSDYSASAIMGQVRYPIDSHALSSDVRWMHNNNMVFHFDIGDLDIQAGREELSYDKATIAALEARVRETRAEIEAGYAELFRDCKNIVDASLIVRANPSPMHNVIVPTFGGTQVRVDYLQRCFDSNAYGGRAESFGTLPGKAVADDITLVLMNVDRKTAMRRWNIWRAENQDLNGYRVIVTPGQEDEYLERVGDIAHVLLSDTPLPTRKAKMRLLGEEPRSVRDRPEQTIDLNTGGYYLVTRNLRVIHPSIEDEHLNDADLAGLQQRLLKSDIPDADKIVLVPWSRRRELGDGWTDAATVIGADYEKQKGSAAFADMLEAARTYRAFTAAMFNQGVCFTSLARIARHCDDGPVSAFVAERERCRNASVEGAPWEIVQRVFDTNATQDMGERLSLQWGELCRQFPMLIDLVKHRHRYETVGNIVAEDAALYVNAKQKVLTV